MSQVRRIIDISDSSIRELLLNAKEPLDNAIEIIGLEEKNYHITSNSFEALKALGERLLMVAYLRNLQKKNYLL